MFWSLAIFHEIGHALLGNNLRGFSLILLNLKDRQVSQLALEKQLWQIRKAKVELSQKKQNANKIIEEFTQKIEEIEKRLQKMGYPRGSPIERFAMLFALRSLRSLRNSGLDILRKVNQRKFVEYINRIIHYGETTLISSD
jgi:hypothetical protein